MAGIPSSGTTSNTGDRGEPTLSVRKDVQADLAGADGNYAPLQLDSSGALRVINTGGAGGGTSAIDNSAFTGGTTSITPMGAIYDTTPPVVGDGNVGAPRMSVNRDLHILPVTDDGTSAGDDANDAIRVNVVAGGASGGTSMTDDTAFTPGTTSVTPSAGTYRSVRDLLDDNDAGAIALNQSRGVFVTLENSSATEIGTVGAPIRVDPTGTTTQPISAASLPLPTGAATSANQLPDGHNVTVDNAAGASAVNIQDGGNTITVDGSVTSIPSGTQNVDVTANTVGLATSANQTSVIGTDGLAGPASVLSIGGTQTTGEIQELQVDADGQLQIDVISSALPTGAATSANQLPDGHNVTVDNASGASAVNIQDGGNSVTVDAPVATPVNVQVGNGTLTQGVVDETGASAVDATAIGGGTPHDSVDSGNPIKLGAQAVNVGATPTAVAAADRTNLLATRYGQLFTLGGHMNVTRREYRATTAQTDDAIIDTIAAGNRVVITEISCVADNANTADIGVRIGFGTASVPTEPTDGNSVDGMVLSHPGIAKGSGIVHGSGSGIVSIGGDGEELRITTDAAQAVKVVVTFFTYAA